MTDPAPLKLLVGSAIATCVAGLALDTWTGRVALSAALSVLATVVAVSFTRLATRHRHATEELTARSEACELSGTGVHVGDHAGAVFVAGLARPRIFCDRSTAATLRPHELRAVLLHEQGHQRARDPLRLTILAAVTPLLQTTATGSALVERLVARCEIAADRYALRSGATRADLASALLKVPTVGPSQAVGFSTATDLRLAALTGVATDRRVVGGARWAPIVVGALTGAVLCTALAHVLLSTSPWPCCL